MERRVGLPERKAQHSMEAMFPSISTSMDSCGGGNGHPDSQDFPMRHAAQVKGHLIPEDGRQRQQLDPNETYETSPGVC